MAKTPTRSPTHEGVELGRLSSMGLELEDIAEDERVTLAAVVELAEDRGRPVGHYLAALVHATDLQLTAPEATVVTAKVCTGTCQLYGALDVLDQLADRAPRYPGLALLPTTCLDRCDRAPAVELHGDHAPLVLAPATIAAIDEALAALTSRP